jgi:hypothetical protein
MMDAWPFGKSARLPAAVTQMRPRPILVHFYCGKAADTIMSSLNYDDGNLPQIPIGAMLSSNHLHLQLQNGNRGVDGGVETS